MMLHTQESASDVESALSAEFQSALSDARARIAAVLEPACPTVTFLDALTVELTQAANDPNSVPYPDLIDADAYWEASVKPQARALRSSVVSILEWLESRIINTMEVAEAELKQIVDTAVEQPGPNPAATRAELAAGLDRRCASLYAQMGELVDVLPSRELLDESRAAFQVMLQTTATADVDQLKHAYLRDAGGDHNHQQFAEQQWANTYVDRVDHRRAMLAASMPWRHQELALVGYERARDEADNLVDAAVARLQAPLGGLSQLLLARFDNKREA